VFLRTDTHWSPHGAITAANQAAEMLCEVTPDELQGRTLAALTEGNGDTRLLRLASGGVPVRLVWPPGHCAVGARTSW